MNMIDNHLYSAAARPYQSKMHTTKVGAFPEAPLSEIDTHLKHERRFSAYLKRALKIISPDLKEVSFAIALFDPDGYLLKVYGNESVVDFLEKSGIIKYTVWGMEDLGPNAVTVGLATKQALFSVGEENHHLLLKSCAIYFAPAFLNEYTPPFSLKDYGGIAIIVPAANHKTDYLTLATSLSHDIILNMHFVQTAHYLFEQTGRSVLVCDLKMSDGCIAITYCSPSLFQLFNIPYQDVEFQPLTDFFDPLPANEEFWEIVKDLTRATTDRELPLSIRGIIHHCILSSIPYCQPTLNTEGNNLFITTRQQVVSDVTKKLGTNTVLGFRDIIGSSPSLMSAKSMAQQIANLKSNVMILGESGAGKDVFAQAIHNSSIRSSKPFIVVNCAALPRELIASELFGYDGGAFTGAKKQGNIGKFELANEGTLFLDEIGDLPLDIQATLLRAVEQKQFMRIGSNKVINVDIRIISATNANIADMIANRQFREDLFYRLSTMQIDLPPLRDRENDIILLAEHFIKIICQRIERSSPMYLSDEAKELLLTMPWKGNARELQNLIERVVQLYSESLILPTHILACSSSQYSHVRREKPAVQLPRQILRKNASLTQAEILAALDECNGSRTLAADYLGISRRTLYRYIDRFGIW